MRREVDVFVATIMSPEGKTGVQTHFNTFVETASRIGLNTRLVTPFGASKLVVYPVFGLRMLLHRLNRGAGAWWYWYWHYVFVRQQIFKVLRSCTRTAIVYAQDPFSAKAALDLRDKGYPVEVALVVHFNVSQAYEWVMRAGIPEGGKLFTYLTRLEEQVLPRVDRLLFPSRFMQEQVTSRISGAKHVSSWVIPHFVPSNGAAAGSGEAVTGELITIGAIEPRKNHEFLLQALKHAHRLGHLYRLTVVGSGVPEHRQKLKRLAANLGLNKHVVFTGYLPNAADLIPHHSVYVHASRMDNLPYALLEALAAARPIVAAPVGGIPEIFADGVEGLYWSLDDPAGAAELLIKVLEDRTLYEQMSSAAQERYESRFSPAAVLPQWMRAVLGPS